MAADVSFLVRALNEYMDNRMVGNEPAGGNSTALITRDLLSGGFGCTNISDSQELDLDLEVRVPNGWEKRLDLKSGKVYLQRCNSSISSSSSSDHKNYANQTLTKLQDFNATNSSSSKVTLNLFDEDSLDLKLVSSSTLSMPYSSLSSNYQNVCTLDKVKSALERVEKEPSNKRPIRWKSLLSLSPSYSSSSLSSMREIKEEQIEETFLSSPVAVGCPNCLSYVLIMKSDPKCPRCSAVLPISMSKKPRIDLNISI